MSIHDDEYAKMVNAILEDEANVGEDRTGTGTIATVGYKAVYPFYATLVPNGDYILRNFPLLTTKKVHFKSVLAELMWLINGHTNISFLERNNVRIWREWPYKNYKTEFEAGRTTYPALLTPEEFGARVGQDADFARRWGNLGPVYGKQWREWETYDSIKFDESDADIDQFSKLLVELKTKPTSRRHIVNAWNPGDIEEMDKTGLPPCHTMFQFVAKLRGDQYVLDLIMYQRSLDVFLGAPFNIASYSLMLGLVAEHVGMVPNKFVHMIADCHIYKNHIETMKQQMTLPTHPAPDVVILKGALQRLMDKPVNYSGLDYEEHARDVVLMNYQSNAALAGKVAV